MKKLFRLDPHVHTGDSSKCGRIPADELVDVYKAAGYDGVTITDHMHKGYINLLYCREDWDTCVDRYLDGYRRAKKRGDQVGLAVLLGMEIRFEENNNDYLVYGIDENWLYNNPYPYKMGPKEFFKQFGNELLIIHAHPYRDGNEFVRLNCVHGVEVVNSHPDHINDNQRALELYRENPHLYPLCASDSHRKKGACISWVEFQQPSCGIADMTGMEYKNIVESCQYSLGSSIQGEQNILSEAMDFFENHIPKNK